MIFYKLYMLIRCFNKIVIKVMISNIWPFIWIIDPDFSRKHVRALGKALKQKKTKTFCRFNQNLVSKILQIDK